MSKLPSSADIPAIMSDKHHLTAIVTAKLICAAITTRIGPRTYTADNAHLYAFPPEEEAILDGGGSVTIVGPIHSIDPAVLINILHGTALEGHELCVIHLLGEPYQHPDPFYDLIMLYGHHVPVEGGMACTPDVSTIQ